MAASAARASFGALFYLGGTSGTAMGTSTAPFIAIGEILSLNFPTYTANSIDLTNQNTTDKFKEFIGGVRDAGSLSITANYLSSTTMHNTTVPLYFNNGYKAPWKITLAGDTTMNIWYGFGYITSYNVTSPPDGAVSFGISIKVTGKPTGPADSTA